MGASVCITYPIGCENEQGVSRQQCDGLVAIGFANQPAALLLRIVITQRATHREAFTHTRTIRN